MSSRTTNLNLEKPANTDYVDVDVINSNSDKIDTFAGQVLNGDYVQDSNYVHTDNNFTSTLKNKLDGVEANANNYSLPTASTGTLGGVKVDGSTITIDSNGIISSTGGGGGGTTVIANPSGTATAALEKLQVGQTIYSSGGTTVIGNPSGTATADLEKIQIGNNVYNIPIGSIVEGNPVVFVPNGTTYTVSITRNGNSGASISTIQYVNGVQTSSSSVNVSRGGSAEDSMNLNFQYFTDGLYVKSKTNSIRFGKVVAGTNGILLTCNPQDSAQTYELAEGNASPSVNTLQTLGIDNELYQLPSDGSITPTGTDYVCSVPVATGMWNSYAVVTQYVNGVMTAQDALTYAKLATGTSNITVGNVKCERTTSSGVSKYVFTALTDSVECNGNIYNTNDVIAECNVTTYPTVEFSTKASEVTISSPSSLSGLSDVSLSSLTNGQVLKYNSTTEEWENADESGGSGSTVEWTQITESGTKIAEIEIDGVSTNVYAPTSGGASALNDLSDVNVNYGTLGNQNVLQYDSASAKWTNAEIPRNLANQGDVVLSSPTNGQVLTYNSTTNKWENANGGGGTTVVANPQETATDELEKIQIGNTIYSVSSGGGGGTGSGKTLVKKTKTYTGDGQIPLVVTFDEKPLLVYSIYGPGLNESNTVRMYPFVYGETKASGRYINNDSSSSNIGYTIAYSNNDLTISVTSNPQDAGACLNNNGSSFTITYLVEENTSSGDYKDLVRTLTVGTTSLTISDIGITSTTTPLIWTSSPLVAPTNMVITSGSITLTFEAQQSNVDVLVRLTKSNAERSYDISLKQFVTGKVFSFMSTQYSTIEEVSNGIKMSGGTTANDWTTNSTVGIDLQQYTIPSGLSKINIHFASIETADYAGICIINSDTLFSGTSPYDDILRASRIYQFEDTTGVDLTDYDIEFNCSSLTGRYLYIMCCDGITPNTPEYDNAKNGTFNVIVDGLNFITGGGE